MALVALAVVWAGLSQVTVSAFSSVTGTPANTLTAASLDPFIPATVTAARASPTTCAVSWTASAAAGPPSSLTYDVTDGSGTTLATAISGLSTTITIGSTSVTPTVKARAGTWLSASATTSSAACVAVPDAPAGVTLTPGDQTLTAAWTAASGNGSPVTGYTVTATPVAGGASTTCTTTSATTCPLTGLTNGTAYTVTVTATNVNGTGPASTPVTGTPISSRPLDAVSAPSAAAYSLRRLRAGYSGFAVQVRRASDNATSDIGFSGSGDLDTTTLGTFCAATSCYVKVWYDQSGNSGRDLTQTTAAYQPRIVNAGTPDLANGRPTVIFSGAQQLITGASAVSIGGTALTGNAVGYSSASSGWSGRFIAYTAAAASNDWDNSPSASVMSRRNANTVGNQRNATTLTASTTDDTLGLFSTIFDGTNDTVYLGATSASSAASSGSFASTGALSVGAQKDYTDSNARLAGAVSEVTVYASALGSADRAALANSQQAYYVLPSSPTPLVTTPGDGQAAVSWTAPTVAGANPITSYTATATPGGQTCTVGAGSTSCTITGLTNGVRYALSVTATSASGTGSVSNTVTAIPRPALVTSANSHLWLDGTDPDGNDVIAKTAESCDTATTCASTSNLLTRWKDKSGKAHDAVQATTALAGTFSPANDGVSFSANGYYQAGSIAVAPDVTAFAVAKSAVTPFNTYGWLLGTRAANGFVLHPNTASTAVQAIAMKGDATNSQATNTAATSPTTAITNLHLWDTQVSGTSSVAGNLATDGQLGTTVTATLAGGAVRAAATLTLTIGGDDYDLAGRRGNGTLEEILVFNRALTGSERRTIQDYLANKWSLTITPQAPSGLTLTPGDTTSTAAWTAPASNGGAAVTSYTVTAVPSDGTLSTVTCTTASTGCTLTGLVDGAQYATTVTATNSAGTGPASSSVTVIPYPATVMTSSATRLWLDAAGATLYSDSGCTTPVTSAGQTVQCWKDKSTYANTVSNTTGSQSPTAAATTVGNLLAPSFDGVDDQLKTSTNNGMPVGSSDSTSFVVSTITAATPSSLGTRNLFRWGALSTTGGGRAVYLSSGAGGSNAVSTTTITDGTFTSNVPQLETSIFSSGSTYALRVAGRPTVSQAYSYSTGFTSITVGSASAPPQGPIQEIIALNSALSATDLRTMEEYLARKWGVTITPGAPGTPTANATNAQAAVSWTAPAWTGGSAITGYTVTASPGGATCTAASTSCTVTGLANGTAYTFTVTATNAIGIGPASAASAPATPPGPPGSPTGLAATAGDTTAALTWTAPATSAPYTGYTATATATGQSTATCTSATTSCTLTGLTNGAVYTVSVTATNAAGTGAASSTILVVPYPSGVMTGMSLWLDGADSSKLLTTNCSGAVATTTVGCWKDKSGSGNDVAAVAGSQQPVLSATGSFSVPLFDGVDDMLYKASSTLPTGTSTSTTFAVSELTDATPTSSGDRGPLAWGGSTTGQVRALYKPASTQNIAVSAYNTTVAANGTWPIGSPVLSTSKFASAVYDLSTNGNPAVSQSYAYSTVGSAIYVSNPTYVWKGRVDEVVVFNSALSTASRRQVEEYLARKWGMTITPGTPGAVTASAGSGQAQVSWTAPTWNGGATITGYTVTASPGGATCTPTPATNTSCTVTGLSNGTSYTFAVTATNSAGIGPATTSSATTPLSVPGAPTGVAATAGDTTSSVSWTAPASNGGATITSYTATAVPSDGTLATVTCSAASSPCTLTGLTDGGVYSVTVTATNSQGTSAASSAVTLVPYPSSAVMTSARLKLWLDAADTTTLLASSACTGGAATTTVGCWLDKSTSANNVSQATGAAQPTVTTVKGWSVPLFNGSSQYLSGNATLVPTGTTSSTVVVAGAVDPSVAMNGISVLAYGGTTAGSQRRMTSWVQAGVDANTSPQAFASAWPGSTAQGVVVGEFASGTGLSVWANGDPGATASGAYTTGTNHLWVGAGGNSTPAGYWKGNTGEVLVFTGTLTAADRRTLQEYLARKWGGVITPSAPGAVTANAGAASASVSWTAPAWNGGATITTYTVTASPGGQTCTATYPTTSCTVNGLSNGTAYTFTATATNTAGVGPASAASGSVTPVDVPAIPTLTSATAGDAQVALAWTAPFNNGAAITGYTISWTWTSGSGGSGSGSTTVGAVTSSTVSSLTNGYSYSFTVAATNSVGTGAASSSLTSIPYPATVMSSANLSLWLDGADQSTLFQDTAAATPVTNSSQTVGRWNDKSGKTDGSGINYGQQATAGSRPSLSTVAGHLVPTFNGTSQYLGLRSVALLPTGSASSTVYAVAANTDSAPSSYRTVFEYGTAAGSKSREIDLPGASKAMQADIWSAGIVTDSTWSTNQQVAGAQFTSTQVTLWAQGRPGLSTSGLTTATGTTFANVGAENNNSFYWMGTIPEVIEFNLTLTSSQRRQVEEYLARKWGSTITPAAPTGVAGSVASTTSVTATWTVPSWNGGASVTSYTVTSSPGGFTCSTASTSCTVSGLTHNTAYTFTVTATNSVGVSSSSTASGSVTP